MREHICSVTEMFVTFFATRATMTHIVNVWPCTWWEHNSCYSNA